MKPTARPPASRQRELFLEALARRDPAERGAFLDGACGDDKMLRESVEELLAHHHEDSFLEESPAGSAFTVNDPESPTEPPGDEAIGDRIGRYKLLQKIGEGGCGIVYLAEQEEPVRRRVALKVIKLGMDTKSVIARFEAERQALAMMDHPNIAKVLEAGATESGRPYFVMELVRGDRITEYCDQHHLATRDRLDLFIKVCQAIQHAHQKGIIHRDIKPSNILVTLHDGVAVPKVIDFGIAKATSDQHLTDRTLFTVLEQFIGTPAYMSPEQAEMGLAGAGDIDTRSDIYSLGVLLYELLAGSTPFDAKELMASGLDAMRQTIREKEPVRPSTKLSQTLVAADVRRFPSSASGKPRTEDDVRASSRHLLRVKETIALLRGDLDWIVMKCLEKDRARRYETANGLASDIRRHLNHEAVLARPPSAAYRFRRVVQRNKLVFAAVTAVATVLVLGVIVSTWLAIRADRARAGEAAQRRRADTARIATRQRAYAAEMNVAFQALAENNLAHARELLDRQPPKPGEEDLRGFEWRHLWLLCRGDELTTFRGEGGHGAAFSPDARLLACASENEIVVRDVQSRMVVGRILHPTDSVAFSPRTNLMASGSHAGVTIWSTDSWREVRALPGARFNVVFSPDGRWLVTGAPGGFRVWNTETWEPVGFCEGELWSPWHLRNAAAISPDGKLLITPSSGEEMDTASGFYVREFPSLKPLTHVAFPGTLSSAAFMPDGKHLLTGRFSGTLLVWDIQQGKIVESRDEHTGWISVIVVARDGKTFITSSADRSLVIWDVATIQPLARLRGHLAEIWALALAPDGRTLASGSNEGTKLWDTVTRHASPELTNATMVAGFSADSRMLVALGSDRAMLWDVASDTTHSMPVGGVLRPPFAMHRGLVADVHGREPLGVIGRTNGAVELWNFAARALVVSWPAHDNPVTVVKFSPDGRLIATGTTKGGGKLWDASTHREVARFACSECAMNSLAFSSDGRLLAGSSDSSPRVWVWDIVSGRVALELDGHDGDIMSVEFSPDGQLLAAATRTGNNVLLWSIPSGQLRATLRGHLQSVGGVTFSPDGKTLATGSHDRRVKLWNLATEQEVATLRLNGSFRSFEFSPDGRTLAVGSADGIHRRLRLWRAPSWEEIAAAEAKDKTNPSP